VDMRRVMQAVEEHYGNPVDVTRGAPGTGGLALNASSQ
jgi:hypothetical protein